MTRRYLRRVEKHYERLFAEQPDLPHEERLRVAEEAASHPDPPQWPYWVLTASGFLLLPLLAIGAYLGMFALMDSAAGGSDRELQSQLNTVGRLLLVAWGGLLVGIIGVAATNNSSRAREGALIGGLYWVGVTLWVIAESLFS